PYMDGISQTDLETASLYETSVTLQQLYEAGYLSDAFDQTDPDVWVPTDPWNLQPATVLDELYGTPTGKSLSYIETISSRTYDTAIKNDPDGHYIELKFWVFSQQADDLRNFNLSSMTISATDQDGKKEEVANAVRVSMWMDDSLYGSTATVGDATIFGNDANYDYDFNDGNANETVIDENNALNTSGGDTYVGALESAIVDVDDAGFTAETIFQIEKETPTLLTILIYVEGWNSFADNDIAESEFNFTFTFNTSDII
ncbi:MAG: hypothetical protein WCS32_01715, partial [Candidatus Izemoplasmatales bacterium]